MGWVAGSLAAGRTRRAREVTGAGPRDHPWPFLCDPGAHRAGRSRPTPLSRASSLPARARRLGLGAWPPVARRRSEADPASASSSSGCSRTCVAVRARCWSSGARRASARRRCCSTALGRPPASGSRRSRESSPRWSCRSRGCTSSARRCSTGSTALPEPQQAALRVALGLASGAAPDRFLVALGRAHACWPRSRRSARCCASSTTHSGSTAPRRQVLGFVARRLLAESVALVFAVRDPADARARGSAGAAARRAPRRGCPRAARHGHPGPDRRARPRPDRRRDPRQPARAAGASARALDGAAGRWLRAAAAAAPVGADRGELPATARGAAAGRRSCCSWSRRPSPSATRR